MMAYGDEESQIARWENEGQEEGEDPSYGAEYRSVDGAVPPAIRRRIEEQTDSAKGRIARYEAYMSGWTKGNDLATRRHGPEGQEWEIDSARITDIHATIDAVDEADARYQYENSHDIDWEHGDSWDLALEGQKIAPVQFSPRGEPYRTSKHPGAPGNQRKSAASSRAASKRRFAFTRRFNGQQFTLQGSPFKTKAEVMKRAKAIRSGAYYNARIIPVKGGYNLYVGTRKNTRDLNRMLPRNRSGGQSIMIIGGRKR